MVLTVDPFVQNQWLWLFVIAPLSLILSFYFYRRQDLESKPLKAALVGLRALALTLIGILLLNPQIKQKSTTIVKPELTILMDQSQSMGLNNNLDLFYQQWQSDERLNQAFQIHWYGFGAESFPLENLNFDQTQTNIGSAVSVLDQSLSSTKGPMIVLTDGQQTFGPVYPYYVPNARKLYPVIVGDTVWPQDLSIERISANPVVRKDQAFEVELLLKNFGRKKAFETKLQVYKNDRLIKSMPVRFEQQQTSKLVIAELSTFEIGPQSFRWTLAPLAGEKMTGNNSAVLDVECLEDQRRLLLVYERAHPDVGAIFRGLSADHNTIVVKTSPNQAIDKLNEVDAVILFDPDTAFDALMGQIAAQNINTWLISGPDTRWDLIQKYQPLIQKDEIGVSDDVFSQAAEPFSLFINHWDKWDLMPPLRTDIGVLSIDGPKHVMLKSRFAESVESGAQLAFFEDGETRWVLWDGLGVWRWRLAAYRIEQSHAPFDEFLGILAKYVSKNKPQKALNLDYKTLYQQRSTAEFRAQYIDKTGALNLNSRLELVMKDRDSNGSIIRPMLRDGKSYRTGLSDLSPGVYDFKVRVLDTDVQRSGRFEIAPDQNETGVGFAKIEPMRTWAEFNGVKLRHLTQMNQFKQWLVQQEEFKPRVKVVYENLDFIRWYYALALLILTTSSEWFIRKYNGLI